VLGRYDAARQNGRATGEGGPNLLHQEDGKWKVKDLSAVPEDPKDPLGPKMRAQIRQE
jgi:hypothetical protein